jgi:Cytochrome c oxidase caa3 assembly factor (Caa3_CtaG)
MGHHGGAYVAHGHDGRPGRVTAGGLETTVSAATAAPGGPPSLPGWRRLLGVTGPVLVLACLLPPLDTLGRRYVFAESLQFCVFAMAGPALIVLGAPWRFLRLARPTGWRQRGGTTGRSGGRRSS